MRRFTFIAVPFFVLLAAVALAVPVDPVAVNGIAAQNVENLGGVPTRGILCTNGSIYTCEPTGAWTLRPSPIPVPIDDIADWTQSSIVTHSGEVWIWYIIMGEGGWQWHRWGSIPALPAPPCGSVASEKSTHGEVKARFR
jgi:hypothetical protein